MSTVDSLPDIHVIGHDRLLSRLRRDVREGRLSHAYILDGPVGSGRHTVARWLCASLACENRPNRTAQAFWQDQNGQLDMFGSPQTASAPVIPPDAPLPCGICPACRKVLNGSCPDIRFIGRGGKTSIGVDAVRFLRQDVLIPPNDLDTRIYIIEDAEAMTVQAQNALLLTLEEPPPYVLFLLLCNGTESLLETIRSRAPTLRTQPVPDTDVRAYLSSHRRTLPEEELSAVLLRAGGCIGQAMALTDARTLKPILRNRAMVEEFVTACAGHELGRVLACMNQWGTKREGVCDILDGVNLALRDLLLLRRSEGVRLLFYTDRDNATELAFSLTARALLDMSDTLFRARGCLEANGNVRLTLTSMGLAMCQAGKERISIT